MTENFSSAHLNMSIAQQGTNETPESEQCFFSEIVQHMQNIKSLKQSKAHSFFCFSQFGRKKLNSHGAIAFYWKHNLDTHELVEIFGKKSKNLTENQFSNLYFRHICPLTREIKLKSHSKSKLKENSCFSLIFCYVMIPGSFFAAHCMIFYVNKTSRRNLHQPQGKSTQYSKITILIHGPK